MHGKGLTGLLRKGGVGGAGTREHTVAAYGQQAEVQQPGADTSSSLELTAQPHDHLGSEQQHAI